MIAIRGSGNQGGAAKSVSGVTGDQINLWLGLVAEEINVNLINLFRQCLLPDLGTILIRGLDSFWNLNRVRFDVKLFGRLYETGPEFIVRAAGGERLEPVLGLSHLVHRLKDRLAALLELSRGRN